ncbi:hypothetical protein BMETH_3239195581, partial [methanotrophic bacterial endosymbiont of Bathymodiolus sp.]
GKARQEYTSDGNTPTGVGKTISNTNFNRLL